jgi:hypothetical protein
MNSVLLSISSDNAKFKSIINKLDKMAAGSKVGEFKKTITGWQDCYGNWCSTTNIAEQVFYNIISI